MLFASLYRDISFEIARLGSVDESLIKQREFTVVEKGIFMAFCIFFPAVVSLLRYFSVIDKLDGSGSYSRTLNWSYFITLQICLALALLIVFWLITSIMRIRKNFERLRSLNLLKDETFVRYHMFAFALYIANLFIYDMLVCAYADKAYVQFYSIGFLVCNFTLPISSLIVQLMLCLIVAKYIGELRFIELSERYAVD